MVRQISHFFLLLLFFSMMTSCNVWKYLPEDAVLLRKNEFHFAEDSIPDMKKELARLENKIENIDSLQKPNSVTLGLFYTPLSVYFRYCQPEDSTWFKKAMCTTLGNEPPSYYDQYKSQRTSHYVKILLQNQGYIDAQVTARDTVLAHKAKSKYFIELGRQMTVGEYTISTPDMRIDSLLLSNREDSKLSPGGVFSQDQTTEEKNRIVSLLRNNGYALFNQNNVQGPYGDGVDSLNRADVNLKLVDNYEKTAFTTFKIGDIRINKNYETLTDSSLLQTYEKDSFSITEDPTAVRFKDKHILNQLYLKPGEYYSLADINETRKRMNRLSYFRYIQIRESADPQDSTKVNFDILLRPDKRYDFSSNLDLNYTTGQNNRWIGGSIGLSLIDKNAFGGSESLNIGLDTELLFRLRGLTISNLNKNLSNFTFYPYANLTIPRFNDYLGLYSFLKFKRFNEAYKNLSSNANTSIGLSYRHEFFEEIFRTDLINMNYGIKMSWKQGDHQLSVSNLDFSYFNPERLSLSEDMSNPLFDNRFQKALSTAFILGQLSYRYFYNNPVSDWSYTIYNNFTLSGAEVALVSWIANIENATLGDVEFNQRIGLDQYHVLRKNWPNDISLFYRLNIGAVTPFGSSDDIPFVNQFMLGGANSMRAWQRGELGIGGYRSVSAQQWADSLNIYYQTADFKLETNLEYMFEMPFINVLDGAIFTDVGNIWNFRSDIPETVLRKDFLSQLAVGVGGGIRWDAQFFLLRVDFAFKIRNPYPNEQGSHYFGTDFFNSFRQQPSIRFALNYPFDIYE